MHIYFVSYPIENAIQLIIQVYLYTYTLLHPHSIANALIYLHLYTCKHLNTYTYIEYFTLIHP